MAGFTATFYKFKKQTNSTAHPTDSNILFSATVLLKEKTSILQPVLELAGGFEHIATMNYCYVPKFNRYYFITDVSYDKGVCSVSMKVDVMATYKTEIGADERYILRAASYYDCAITDTMDSVTNNHYILNGSSVKVTESKFLMGSVVVGVTNSVQTGLHGSYYVLTYSEFLALKKICWADDFLTQLGDPKQYIFYCRWMPFPCVPEMIPVLTTKVSSIPIPKGEILVTGYQLALDPIKTFDVFKLSVPKSVGVSSGGENPPLWQGRSPFAKYTLIFPGFGEISLEPDLLYQWSYVYCKLAVDYSTGKTMLSIGNSSDVDNSLICRRVTDYGVPLPLDSHNDNFLQAVGGVVSVIGGVAGKSVSSVVGGVSTIADALAPSVERSGSVGSVIEFDTKAYVQAFFQLLTAPNPENNGRPVHQRKKISLFTGFVKCGDGYTKISGTNAEYETVNNIMKEGFYYV